MGALHPFRIGSWVIDPGRCVACKGGDEVRLEPKTAELVAYLASRSGTVISRGELLDAVWPGMVVGDEAITNAVAKLRKALGDDSRTNRLIETVPKRGYRVVADSLAEPVPGEARARKAAGPWMWFALVLGVVLLVWMLVVWIGQAGDQAPPVAETPSIPDRPSVSVLPFVNLSDDPAQEYFADGLTEDLITDLSRVSSLFVIARNSSFSYKNRALDVRQVGRELGVKYLVEGNVRKVGGDLRINIKLIDASKGGQLWGERFDGALDELFDFQEMITGRIVEALSVERTHYEEDFAAFRETNATAAYENYLKGAAEYTRGTPESFRLAITHLERAVEADPSYGRALATLAAVYWETYRNLWHRRLDISPNTQTWQRADDYLVRSMIAPTALAHKVAAEMLTFNRRYQEARKEAEVAIALDPNSPQGYVALAEVQTFMGAPEKALPLLHRAMRMDPRGHASYFFALGKAQLAMGNVTDAVASLAEAVERSPENRLAWMALLSAYGTLGDVARATRALARLDALQASDRLYSFTVSVAREHWPFARKSDRESFLYGLRKAGVPEG
jgi:TolB-like protein/DNA-binding winged helix-turn-helix (wHTH) protein/thioredoxin-like negative regulator of GroEL